MIKLFSAFGDCYINRERFLATKGANRPAPEPEDWNKARQYTRILINNGILALTLPSFTNRQPFVLKNPMVVGAAPLVVNNRVEIDLRIIGDPVMFKEDTTQLFAQLNSQIDKVVDEIVGEKINKLTRAIIL